MWNLRYWHIQENVCNYNSVKDINAKANQYSYLGIYQVNHTQNSPFNHMDDDSGQKYCDIKLQLAYRSSF